MQQKITKKVNSREDSYSIYIGILQAVTGFKITDQEKEVLSVILSRGGLTKIVREYLITQKTVSKQRLDNIISKFRSKGILNGDKPNSRFPIISDDEATFSITLIKKTEEATNGGKE